MERERVVAVSGPGGRGSGYVIAPRLVLTSAHVVTALEVSVTVFRPGGRGTITARPVWCGTPAGRDDVALVLIDDPAWIPLPDTSIAWGRTVTYQPGIPCHAWGRPQIVQRNGRPPDTSQVTGSLNPGSRIIADRYQLELDSFPPGGDSPWAGMSGAAVFCGDLLAGVVAVDPANRQHAALEAVPAYVLLHDKAFVTALAKHAGGDAARCEAIELQPLSDARSHVSAGGPVRSPAALLTARRAVVPFRGRDEVLGDLHAWAAQPGVGVWLLHGQGGQGKTRLAHEFATQLQDEGQAWTTVWLNPAADIASIGVLAALSSATLVVVDYAENRAEQLTALFTALSRVGSTVAVKVLLLARTAGAWWDELSAVGGDAVRDIAELVRRQSLPVLDATPQARTLTYQAAVSAFATALRAVPGLSDQSWTEIAATLPEPADVASTVLAVQMTALADLLDAAASPVDLQAVPDSPGPEDRVLTHEQGYWTSTATAQGLLPGLTLATLTDLVIATAILGPTTLDEVGGVVARVPGLADQPADRQNAASTWLLSVYPADDDGTVEGLVPDRLAERLVGRSILDTGRTCVVGGLAVQADAEEAKRLLTLCTRAAAHTVFSARVGDKVTQWCVEQADTLAVAAIDVATRVETPLPLVRAIDQVTANNKVQTSLLERMEDAFPLQSQVHAEAATAISEVLVDRARQVLAKDPGLNSANLALRLNNLANRLGDLGRHEAGLEAITEAVEIYRQLAEQRPDAFRPYLASSLNNLANRLGDLGRHEAGLEAITEAVEIYRQPAEQRPNAFRPDLAMSLNNLANRLGDLGRHEAGLEAITEAVEIYRQLAKQRPNAFRPNFAKSLNNLANRLGNLGRWEDALEASTEAVEIRRQLAEQRPDAFRPNLATSLNNLANQLGDLGRHEAALEAITEAVEIRRQLAEQRPDTFRPNLATSLNNLANRLGDLGRHEAGLEAITEAVEIRRQLAEQRPDTFRPDLASSVNNLAIRLGDLGHWEDALEAITEAVEIYRQLAKQRPDAFRPNLATSLNNLGNQLGDLGRHEAALEAITEAVEIRRQLAEQRPNAFQADLAMSLNNLANALGDLGRHEAGLEAITEAVEIYRQLAEQRPDTFRPNLASSLNNLAIQLGDLGRWEDALEASTEAVTTYRGLAEQRPNAYLKDLNLSRRIMAWLNEGISRQSSTEDEAAP
ncbi:tetratricopeptide repeat-containing serine protease family protein [Amycolatopsis japonica]|uniref:tetratricopeptide repeat-containing serine protease family protein n=1 Tax=Amycolatopsis japonica TaxID=208439 RepID=UPI0033FFEBD0